MAVVDDALAGLTDVIRRTLRARTADSHLIEDLTQETIVKVAGRQRDLAADTLRAYAVVTARHTLADHYRRQATARRHAHRLVDYRSLEGPEQLTLEREETNALASALDRLAEDERALLIDHESEGVSLEELAERHHTTTRAMGMRLARLRASLRVEFVLAVRRIDHVPALCRNVLIALSAGDTRRQHELGAAEHLLRCETCASLSRPIVERRRGIAGWIILPIGEGIRRAVRSLRTNHVTQAVSITVVAAAASVSLVAYRADRQDFVTAPAASTTTAPATTVPATITEATASPVTTTVPATTTVPPTTAVPATTVPAVDPCASASDFQQPTPGCTFSISAALVLEVPADEGFWIQAPDGQPVWVHLVGPSESPEQIAPQQHLDMNVTIRSSVDPGASGIPPDQIARLQQRDFYLEVDYAGLTVQG